MGDQIGVVLLFDRSRGIAFFDVVAHHRTGDLNTAQRVQTLIDVFDGLFQIESHGWDLSIGGQMEMFDIGIHAAIPPLMLIA